MGAPATTLAMQAMKDIMPKEAVWSGFAISKNEMPFVAQTVIMGGNPWVGLEDNLYLSTFKPKPFPINIDIPYSGDINNKEVYR